MPIDTYADNSHAAQFGSTVTLNGGAIVNIDNAAEFVAFQFDSVLVQQGETVTAATLYVESTDNDEGQVTTTGNDVDNAAALAAASNNVSSRVDTTASTVVYMMAVGTKSIDVTAVIQEIVDRPGWVYGARVVLILEGHSPSNEDAYLDLGSVNNELVIDHPLDPPGGGDVRAGAAMLLLLD